MSVIEENNFTARGDIADRLMATAPLAREALLDFRQKSDDQHALLRPQIERLSELVFKLQKLEARLRQITGPGYFPPLKPEDFQHRDMVSRIDRCKSEIARVREIETARSNAWNAAAGVVRIAEDYLASGIPSGCVLVDHQPIEASALLKRGENVIDAVERVRHRGRELAADLHRCRSSPRPSADRKLAMRQQVATLAEAGAPDVSGSVAHGDPIEFPRVGLQTAVFNADPSAIGFSQIVDPIAFAAWLNPDALITALDREIDAEADDAHALNDVERAKAEAQIISDALECDRSEVGLINLAAKQGINIDHRSDISPLALLNCELVTAPPHPAPPRSTILRTILGGGGGLS